jgi:hypothetical protein
MSNAIPTCDTDWTGPNRCAKPTLVCRAIDCHTVRAGSVFTQEAGRGVGPVDLEALVPAAVIGDTQVVQETAEEDEFVVVVDAVAQTVGGGEFAPEQVAADAVVGDECGGDVDRQLQCC